MSQGSHSLQCFSAQVSSEEIDTLCIGLFNLMLVRIFGFLFCSVVGVIPKTNWSVLTIS